MSKLSQFLHRASGGLIPEVNLVPHADDLAKVAANEAFDIFRPAIISLLDSLAAAAETELAESAAAGVADIKAELIGRIANIPEVPASFLSVTQSFVRDYDFATIASNGAALATDDIIALLENVKGRIAGAHF